MTPERWRQMEDLYQAAQAVAPAQRDALLERADPELRMTIASILAQEDLFKENGAGHPNGAFLDRPAWEGNESLFKTVPLVTAGQMLGPYRIVEKIGEGGMGEVYRAIDTRLDRTVAIKTSFVQFTERFEREARVIASLNHPHIATLYDVGSSASGFGYLVLEYVEGQTLADLIRKGPVEPKEARRIALEVAEAIEAAHERGVVHRDLKPANIKLGAGGAVKVLDFGLAKAMDEIQPGSSSDITKKGVVFGTPSYMSPEQVLGGGIDRRSDIWSFGVLVSEMLSGKRLFSGTTPSEIAASVVRSEPDLSNLPPEWAPLLRRCLNTDFRRRLQSIGEARLMLEDGLPPAAPVARGLAEFRVPGSRSWWLWAGAAVVALVWLSAIAWIRGKDSRELANPLARATFAPLTDYEGAEQDAAISPDGKFVAFLSNQGGHRHVWLHELSAGRTVDLTPGSGDENAPLRSLGFSWDGSEVWLAGTERRKIRLLPLVGGEPRVFLGDKAVNPAWSGDGARLAWHTLEPGDPIFVADRDGNNKRQIFRDRPDKHNHFLTWGDDGQWIYFVHGTPAAGDMDLWRIRASGGDPERLTQLRNSDMRDPTPLGKGTILFLGHRNDGSAPGIWAFDTSSKASRRISFGLESYTSLSATADGRRLAVTIANPKVGIWSVPILDSGANESDVRPFAVPSMRALMPRFRGSTLYYVSSQGSFGILWRSEAGKAVQIWRGAQGEPRQPPAISPEGRRIAIVVRQEGKARLRLITADGAESSSLAPQIDVDGSADWSPDGKWIVTGGRDATGEGLFKIDVANGATVRLTGNVGRNPVWSPDGGLIVYSGANVFTLAPLLAVRPDGTPVGMPQIRTNRDGERLRFLPNGRALVYMQGSEASPWQNFWLLDMATMRTRCLTRFTDLSTMRTFDVTPDGKQIVFDRRHENASVVLVDLPARL